MERLQNVLKELSKNVISEDDLDTINKYIQIFQEVYVKDFRHRYTSIFQTLLQICNDTEKQERSLETILGNLELLKKHFKGSDEAQKGFFKFCDHTELEIARIQYDMTAHEKAKGGTVSEAVIEANIEKKVSGFYTKFKEISKGIQDNETKTAEVLKELDKSKFDVIATLSIFSAIVLTFSGGVSYLTETMAGMSEVTSYRLVFTISLIGLVLFNTIFMLLYVVSRLLGKTISTDCRYLVLEKKRTGLAARFFGQPSDKVCGYGFCTKKNGKCPMFVCKLIRKYSYVLMVNIILIIFMLISFSMWYVDLGSEYIKLSGVIEAIIEFIVKPVT